MNSNGISAQLILQIIQAEMILPATSLWLRDQNKTIPADQGLYVTAGLIDHDTVCVTSKMRPAVPEDWDYENQTWDLGGQLFDANALPLNYDRAGETWDNPGQTFDQLPPTQIEENTVQAREIVQVEIFSRSNNALMRNWEIVAALQSIFAQQTQEANQFKICRKPLSFLNTSYAEGGAQLNRYTLTFAAFVWYRKSKVLVNNGGDYYDDFSLRLDSEQTIGSGDTNYDQGGTFDTPGQTFDQPMPMAEFEINQEGIEP